MGAPRESFFFEHGHVAYKIKGNDELNRIQVKGLPSAQTDDLEMRSKGQISLNFITKSISKFFYTRLLRVLKNKRYKIY